MRIFAVHVHIRSESVSFFKSVLYQCLCGKRAHEKRKMEREKPLTHRLKDGNMVVVLGGGGSCVRSVQDNMAVQ